jgi:lipocalin
MKAVEHDPNLCKYTNAVTTWEPAVAAIEEEEPLDNTTLYQIKDGECGEVAMDSKYAPEATKVDKDLKEGTCTSVGYTVADGTQTVKVPVLGSLTVHKYKKPSVTMLTAGDGDLPTQTAFNATAWEGMWYELYSLRQPDEAFCTCTASKFAQTLMPGKWTDQNYCKRFGKMESVPLSMYQLDRRYPERLAIGVSPKHTFTKMWVIKTDYESYSLIGDPSRKALWIYGRAPGMDRTLYSNLTTQASELGFNVAKLKMTDQANNCKYPDN